MDTSPSHQSALWAPPSENPDRLAATIVRIARALDQPGRYLLPFTHIFAPNQSSMVRELVSGRLKRTAETQISVRNLQGNCMVSLVADTPGAPMFTMSKEGRTWLLDLVKTEVFVDLKIRARIPGKEPGNPVSRVGALPSDIDTLQCMFKPRKQLREILSTTKLPKDTDELPEDIKTLQKLAGQLLLLFRGTREQAEETRSRLPELNLSETQAVRLNTMLRQHVVSPDALLLAGRPFVPMRHNHAVVQVEDTSGLHKDLLHIRSALHRNYTFGIEELPQNQLGIMPVGRQRLLDRIQPAPV